MNNRTFPIVVLSALVSGVASALCVVALTPTGSDPTPSTDRSVDLDPLLSRLDDLGQRVDDLTDRVVALHSRTVAEDQRDDAERVELASSVPGRMPLPVAAVAPGAVATDVPQNWNAIYAFAAQAEADHESAMKDVGLFTVPEIIQRFGFPTKVDAHNDAIYLSYYRIGPDGKADGNGHVMFTVMQGYVAYMESHMF